MTYPDAYYYQKLRDFRGSVRYFCKQMQEFKDIAYNGYALTTGEATGARRWLQGQGLTIAQTINGKAYSHQIIVDKHEGIKKILHHERVINLRSLFLLSKVSTKNNQLLD